MPHDQNDNKIVLKEDAFNVTKQGDSKKMFHKKQDGFLN